MRASRIPAPLFVLCAILCTLPPASIAAMAAASPESVSGQSQLFVIPIQGDIEPSTAVFVQRRITAALDAGATIIVFPIDTFGGRVDSALRIASSIGAIRDVRTIAFVGAGNEGMGVSWSAGALIAMSCADIYMAPGTSIGAAAPVLASADGSMEAAGEKTVSALRSQMAALAEKNGHPAGLALAMVDADVELVELEEGDRTFAITLQEAEIRENESGSTVKRGRIIVGKDKLLSLTAGEAERYGLSRGTVRDLEELSLTLGVSSIPVFLEPSFADDIIVLLGSAAFQSILILIGLVALFIEINTPGFGIPGSIALIAFIILFGTSALMGTVGSIEIILFILGMGLLVVEIFLLPGFGVTGISGLALIAFSLVLSMQDFVIPGSEWEWEIFGRNAATVGIGLVLGILGIGLMVAFGPRLGLFDRLALRTAITGTASGRPAPAVTDGRVPARLSRTAGRGRSSDFPVSDSLPETPEIPGPSVGDVGVAETVLRPSGRALVGGLHLSVESRGCFVEAGTRLCVTAIVGGVIYVEPTDSLAADRS